MLLRTYNMSYTPSHSYFAFMAGLQIERVQNLMVYKQYMALNQQMRSKFPEGTMYERRPLWHGTKEEVKDSIIKYGFNRSYCGSKYVLLVQVVGIDIGITHTDAHARTVKS